MLYYSNKKATRLHRQVASHQLITKIYLPMKKPKNLITNSYFSLEASF